MARRALDEVDITVFARQSVRLAPRNGVVWSSIHSVWTHQCPRGPERSGENPVEGFLQNWQIRADDAQVSLYQSPATSWDEIVCDVLLFLQRILHRSRSDDTSDQDTTAGQRSNRTEQSLGYQRRSLTGLQEGKHRKA